MIQNTLRKCRRLRACHVLAAAFLLYIGFVAVRPLEPLFESTKIYIRGDNSLSGYLQSIDDLYYEMLSTEKGQPVFHDKATYINLNGWAARLLGQPVMNYRVTLKNGHLSHLIEYPLASDSELEAVAQNLVSFAQAQHARGKHFLFVLTPTQTSKYEDFMPTGYTNRVHESADSLLALLTEKGVPCLDLREQMYTEKIDQSEAFFVTDHHWKPQTGFWAYTKILEKLEAMGAISPVDTFYTDRDHYQFITYENTFLGSAGKRTGIYYAGLDDSIFIQPAFDTEISVTVPDRDIHLTGRFEDVSYDTEAEVDLEDPDFFSYSAYALYGWGDTKLTHWRNNQAPEEAGVMLIGDSFANVPYSLMSLYFSSCDELDMRHYSQDFPEHYQSFQPDIVIVSITVRHVTDENVTYPYIRE